MKPSMLSQKGQESAPFELLVAVTLMIFVVAAGLNAMNVLGRQDCRGQIDKKLEDMKTAIEIVASGKGAANVDFTLPSCFKNQKVQIGAETRTALCSNVCGGVRIQCTLLKYTSDEEPIIKCLNVSPNTTFITSAPCTDRSSERLELINMESPPEPEKGIPTGYYSLFEVQDVLVNYPLICAYRKTG